MTQHQALCIYVLLSLLAIKALFEILCEWFHSRNALEARKEAIRRSNAEMLRNKEAWKHFNHQIHEDTRPAKIER